MSDIEEKPEIIEENAENQASEPEIAVEIADEPQKTAISAEEGVEELKRRLDSERAARERAEMIAYQAANQAQMARQEVDNSNITLVRTAIDTMKRENDILKENYKAALANNDFDAAAEYQEAMADARAKLLQLENGMAAMEMQARQPVQPVPPPRPSDPVEALASQLSPQSAAWVRAHPEYARNPRLTQKMIAAHNLVTADGINADTPEYFASVERVLGITSTPAAAEEASPLSSASSPAARRPAPAAAPVSRSGTATGTRPNVVRLSSEEREMAEMMGMSPEEYGRHKLALKKEGKLH